MQDKLPGRVQDLHTVDLPRPRDLTDLRFLEMRRELIDSSVLIL